MPQFDEKHIKVCGCTVVWDAITRPDTNEVGTKWSLKLVTPPNNPDIQLLEQFANSALQNSVFQGHLPNGGTMPLGTCGPTELGGMFNGWRVFNAGTYRGCPDVYDENGARLEPMQFGSILYTGQSVDVLVHCYENNKKVKGIALGLNGFSINTSANAQRLNIGGDSVDTAGAFGGQGQANQYQQQPAQNQNQGGQYQQQQPAQNQNQGGQYQQQQPAQNQNQGGQYQQQQPAQNQNGGGQPNQAQNFMPQQ